MKAVESAASQGCAGYTSRVLSTSAKWVLALLLWHGWHAARRGLGSNLYRLGVTDKVIQRILRHANVSTTLGYYVKSQPQDALDAMTKLEKAIPENSVLPDTQRTLSGDLAKRQASIQ